MATAKNKAELVTVAKELNEKILTSDTAIPITGRKATATQLEKDIKEAAALIDPKDKLSEETWKVLREMKIEGLPEKPAVSDRIEKKTPDTVAEVNDDSGEVVEKEKVKVKYSRGHALADAIKQGGTRKEIVKLIDTFYEKHGGIANPKGAEAMMNIHFPVLKIMGIVRVDGKGEISRV